MSGTVCSFTGCKKSYSRDKDTSFFPFPEDPKRRKKWMRNCGNSDLETLPDRQLRRQRICADHFQTKCFLRPESRAALNDTAIPDVAKAGGKPVEEPVIVTPIKRGVGRPKSITKVATTPAAKPEADSPKDKIKKEETQNKTPLAKPGRLSKQITPATTATSKDETKVGTTSDAKRDSDNSKDKKQKAEAPNTTLLAKRRNLSKQITPATATPKVETKVAATPAAQPEVDSPKDKNKKEETQNKTPLAKPGRLSKQITPPVTATTKDETKVGTTSDAKSDSDNSKDKKQKAEAPIITLPAKRRKLSKQVTPATATPKVETKVAATPVAKPEADSPKDKIKKEETQNKTPLAKPGRLSKEITPPVTATTKDETKVGTTSDTKSDSDNSKDQKQNAEALNTTLPAKKRKLLKPTIPTTATSKGEPTLQLMEISSVIENAAKTGLPTSPTKETPDAIKVAATSDTKPESDSPKKKKKKAEPPNIALPAKRRKLSKQISPATASSKGETQVGMTPDAKPDSDKAKDKKEKAEAPNTTLRAKKRKLSKQTIPNATSQGDPALQHKENLTGTENAAKTGLPTNPAKQTKLARATSKTSGKPTPPPISVTKPKTPKDTSTVSTESVPVIKIEVMSQASESIELAQRQYQAELLNATPAEFEKFYASLKMFLQLAGNWTMGGVQWDPQGKRKVIIVSEPEISPNGRPIVKRCLQFFDDKSLRIFIDGMDMTDVFGETSYEEKKDVASIICKVAEASTCCGVPEMGADDLAHFPNAKKRNTAYFDSDCPGVIPNDSFEAVCSSCDALREHVLEFRENEKQRLVERRIRSEQKTFQHPFGQALYTMFNDLVDETDPSKPKKKRTKETFFRKFLTDTRFKLNGDAGRTERIYVEKPISVDSVSASFQDIVSKLGFCMPNSQKNKPPGSTIPRSTHSSSISRTRMTPSTVARQLIKQEPKMPIVEHILPFTPGSSFTLDDGQEYELIGEVEPSAGDFMEVKPNPAQQFEIIEVDDETLAKLASAKASNVVVLPESMSTPSPNVQVTRIDANDPNLSQILKAINTSHGFKVT